MTGLLTDMKVVNISTDTIQIELCSSENKSDSPRLLVDLKMDTNGLGQVQFKSAQVRSNVLSLATSIGFHWSLSGAL